MANRPLQRTLFPSLSVSDSGKGPQGHPRLHPGTLSETDRLPMRSRSTSVKNTGMDQKLAIFVDEVQAMPPVKHDEGAKSDIIRLIGLMQY